MWQKWIKAVLPFKKCNILHRVRCASKTNHGSTLILTQQHFLTSLNNMNQE